MTALITSNSYSNYTADFAFLSGAISRFKPNKIVSSNPLPLRELPSTNLLRNRTVAKPKNRLGERVQNLFKRKTKETPKPYSLRSSALDNKEQRKIISSVNKQLKAEVPKNAFIAYTPSGVRNKVNPNAKTFSTLKEAKEANRPTRQKQVLEMRKEIADRKKSRVPTKFQPQTINTPPLIPRTKEKFKPQKINTPPIIRNARKIVTSTAPSQNQWGFLTENFQRKNPIKQQWGFRTENWRA